MTYYRCDCCGEVFAEHEVEDDGLPCQKCGYGALHEVYKCVRCGSLHTYREMWGDPTLGRGYCDECFKETIADRELVALFLFENGMSHNYAEWCAEKAIDMMD